MMRYHVEPGRLLSAQDPVSNLTETSHSVILNVIHQLGSLASVSSAMFEELGELTQGLAERMTHLASRVNYLRETTKSLSVADEVSVDEIAMFQPFKSLKLAEALLSKRPPGLVEIYNSCEKIPELQRLNGFRSDEKDCRKLYTDPNFFFELWSQQIVEEVEKKRPVKKKQRKNKQETKVRLPENRVEQMKKKTSDYVITIRSTSVNQADNSSTMNNSSTDSIPPSSPNFPQPPPLSPSLPPPAPSSPTSQSSDHAADQDEPLPPAPPPPPPSLLRGHSHTSNRGKSIYSVNDFDRNSLWMPPPPPPVTQTGIEPMIEEEVEPYHAGGPPLAPVPPPPPPPPPANVSGFVAGKEANPAEKSGGGTAVKRKESRTDLLLSIRAGIQLRKVADSAASERPAPKKPEGGAMGALFDVQAIMEMRRRVFEDDDDDDDDDDDADWEN